MIVDSGRSVRRVWPACSLEICLDSELGLSACRGWWSVDQLPWDISSVDVQRAPLHWWMNTVHHVTALRVTSTYPRVPCKRMQQQTQTKSVAMMHGSVCLCHVHARRFSAVTNQLLHANDRSSLSLDRSDLSQRQRAPRASQLYLGAIQLWKNSAFSYTVTCWHEKFKYLVSNNAIPVDFIMHANIFTNVLKTLKIQT